MGEILLQETNTNEFLDSEKHQNYFNESFQLAEKALVEKEVPVGCVFVYQDEQIIGRGFNQVNKTKNPTMHAEFVAIDEIEKWCKKNKKIMSKTTLYVSLEPCVMCASALYQIGIERIVFGASNPRFGGLGSVASNLDYKHIIPNANPKRSILLLQRFYQRENPFAPEEKRKFKNKEIL